MKDSYYCDQIIRKIPDFADNHYIVKGFVKDVDNGNLIIYSKHEDCITFHIVNSEKAEIGISAVRFYNGKCEQ